MKSLDKVSSSEVGAKTRGLKTDTRVSKRAFKNASVFEKMLEASLSIGRQRVGAF